MADLHVRVSFRRPVLWTQKVELWFRQQQQQGDGADAAPPGVGLYQLLLPDEGFKCAMEMEVLGYRVSSATTPGAAAAKL